MMGQFSTLLRDKTRICWQRNVHARGAYAHQCRGLRHSQDDDDDESATGV